jgi:hypothetical protein
VPSLCQFHRLSKARGPAHHAHLYSRGCPSKLRLGGDFLRLASTFTGEYASQNKHLVFILRVPHVCLGLANVGTCSEDRTVLYEWSVPDLELRKRKWIGPSPRRPQIWGAQEIKLLLQSARRAGWPTICAHLDPDLWLPYPFAFGAAGSQIPTIAFPIVLRQLRLGTPESDGVK